MLSMRYLALMYTRSAGDLYSVGYLEERVADGQECMVDVDL